MKLTRIINKFFTYLYFLSRYRSHSVAYVFAHNRLPLHTTSFAHRKGKNIHFDGNQKNVFPLDLVKEFNHPQSNFLISLLNNQDVLLTHAMKDNLAFTVNGINYNVTSQANMSVVNELFSDHYYNISTSQACVVIDIGMNVGYASLYFSSFPNIKKVYSYEPFKETFLIAQKNFSANEAYGKKIKPYNYGISNYTGTVDVPLLEGGSVIASTEESFIKNHHIHSSRVIQVNVRDILEVLKEVKEENPGLSLALKIDCEGEEYNIFERMNDHKAFDHIVFFCIEWHFKGSARLKEILLQNNFIVFDIPKSPEGEYGMIYGFRTTNS